MLQNYFKIAYRNLLKNKHFSLINIAGLAVSICASLFLWLYISYESGYDQFHERSEDIYRVSMAMYIDGEVKGSVPKNLPPLAESLQKSYAEIESYVRMVPIEGTVALANEEEQKVFNEKHLFFVDSTFFKLFSFKWLEGDKEQALKEPNSIVLTRSMAQKYFGNTDVLGRQLVLKEGNMEVPLQVSGIFEDIAVNSHITFDFLVSINTLIPLWGEERVNHDWGSWTFYTYLLLKPGSDPQNLEEKLASFTAAEIAPRWPENFYIQNIIQPLEDIHLHSDMVQEIKPNSNIQLLYILGAVAFLIMMIAWINYTNLTIAKAMDRAREIGIRKVSGASKRQIIKQFIGESVFLNLIGLLIAILLFQILNPYLNQLTGVPLSLWQEDSQWLLILGVFILGTLSSAFYPAIVLSSYSISQTTKSSFATSSKGNFLRKALVIFQFSTSLALIAGTFSIYRQLTFMQQQDLGMNINQMLILPNPDVVDSTFSQKLSFFKNALTSEAGISSVSVSSQIPGYADDFIQGGLRRLGSPEEESINHYSWYVSDNFATTFDLHFLAGRNFSEAQTSENEYVIINKTAAEILGFADADEAIGARIQTAQSHNPLTILGVIDDFNMRSLKADYDPMVFYVDHEISMGYYSVKLTAGPGDYVAMLSKVEKSWHEAFPGNPFDYFFLDDHFNAQYKTEQRFGKVFGIFAFLTICIACLGLFGLSSIAIIQRSKEIGIRKVLGASLRSLLLLLSKEYLYLMMIATIIAIPVANYFIEEWLEGFAFRVESSWIIFLLPTFIVLGIALFSISSQTFKAALQNPVNSLRDD